MLLHLETWCTIHSKCTLIAKSQKQNITPNHLCHSKEKAGCTLMQKSMIKKRQKDFKPTLQRVVILFFHAHDAKLAVQQTFSLRAERPCLVGYGESITKWASHNHLILLRKLLGVGIAVGRPAAAAASTARGGRGGRAGRIAGPGRVAARPAAPGAASPVVHVPTWRSPSATTAAATSSPSSRAAAARVLVVLAPGRAPSGRGPALAWIGVVWPAAAAAAAAVAVRAGRAVRRRILAAAGAASVA